MDRTRELWLELEPGLVSDGSELEPKSIVTVTIRVGVMVAIWLG